MHPVEALERHAHAPHGHGVHVVRVLLGRQPRRHLADDALPGLTGLDALAVHVVRLRGGVAREGCLREAVGVVGPGAQGTGVPVAVQGDDIGRVCDGLNGHVLSSQDDTTVSGGLVRSEAGECGPTLSDLLVEGRVQRVVVLFCAHLIVVELSELQVPRDRTPSEAEATAERLVCVVVVRMEQTVLPEGVTPQRDGHGWGLQQPARTRGETRIRGGDNRTPRTVYDTIHQ